MKRRDFVKYLSSIPFVSTLFAQGASGASEGQREGGLRIDGGRLTATKICNMALMKIGEEPVKEWT